MKIFDEPRFLWGYTDEKDGSAKLAQVQASILNALKPHAQRLVFGRQEHTRKVETVSGVYEWAHAVDGFVTREQGVAVGVFAADCLPIFLWEKSGEAVGVVHAGWRGLQQKILSVAAAQMQGDLGGALGPHICAQCYEVGEEVAGQFSPSATLKKGGKIFLSLSQAAQIEWQSLGYEPLRSDVPCTFCSGDYFSFRKNKTENRQMAFIARK